jgi:hypothetical protein
MLMLNTSMTPKKFTALRLDGELLDGLREVWERDGVSVSEQIRRAVRTWLKSRGVVVVKSKNTERKRVEDTRRRSRASSSCLQTADRPTVILACRVAGRTGAHEVSSEAVE